MSFIAISADFVIKNAEFDLNNGNFSNIRV